MDLNHRSVFRPTGLQPVPLSHSGNPPKSHLTREKLWIFLGVEK